MALKQPQYREPFDQLANKNIPNSSERMRKPFTLVHLAFNWMIELGSVAAFWVVFNQFGMMPAIFWSLVATVIVVILAILIQRRWPFFPLVMCVVVLIFGGYSLLMRDPLAFIVQHTIYYGIGGLILMIGLANGKSLLKPLFENLFALTDHGWTILTWRWAMLFFVLASGNELVWRTMSHAAWTNYKLGMTITVTAFGLWQLRLARRERLPEASAWGLKIR